MDGKSLAKLPSRAAEALLVYVACHPYAVSRDTLATLLWEGRTQQNARGNLRTILSGLRQVVGDYLIVTRHDVAFNHTADYHLDCAEFEALLAEFDETGTVDTLQQAMDLYRGDFLAGFSLRDGLDFEEWVIQEQSRLQRLALSGLQKLVSLRLKHGDDSTSINLLKRLLALDPYDESAQRQLMLTLFRHGERNAALKNYQNYRQQLHAEIGVEPETDTQALYQRLATTAFPPPNNLPAPTSNFIGRAAERGHIQRLLLNPDCRLVSILGPGGIGKTSLSLHAVNYLLATHPGQFLDGVFFVSLVNIETGTLLPCTVGSTLNFKPHGSEKQETQLFNFLHSKELLLILDNFEHLISSESVKWLSNLLATAPNVKILLTSRGRLNLREEHIIDLRGLPYPVAGAAESAENFSAIKLFLQHANRVHYRFEPNADEMTAIIRLCQIVDGMPLAIELAAAETRYFPCEHIASEIEKRLDFQSAPADNRPPRHVSLRATIEYSWTLLSESDPIIDVARRLSVFHGAFALSAAIAVTNATSYQLVSLVDRSFLQRNDIGFFDIHPLIHQFLTEKLAEHPIEAEETRSRHADYYTEIIKSSSGLKHENMERYFFEVKNTVETHFDNIVAAALYLARRHHFPERRLAILIESLIFYFEYSHRYRTWKTIFRQIINALDETPDSNDGSRWLILVLSSRIAQADISLHAYRRAEKQLQDILPDAYALQNDALISACLEMSSIISARAGKFDLALKQAEESLVAVANHPPHYQWTVLRTLGDIAFSANDFAQAETAHSQAFALAKESESETEALSVYKLAMGKIARKNGDLDEARRLLIEALDAARHINKHEDTIACLMELAQVLTDLSELNAAEKLLAEALSLNEQLADVRLGALLALAQGHLATTTGNRADAEKFYRRSAHIFAEIDDRANLSLAQTHLTPIIL